jgi:hypothetical protein
MSIRESFQTQNMQVNGRMKNWTRHTARGDPFHNKTAAYDKCARYIDVQAGRDANWKAHHLEVPICDPSMFQTATPIDKFTLWNIYPILEMLDEKVSVAVDWNH